MTDSTRKEYFNPYKRVSDRIEMLQNQVVIARSAYDKLQKDFRGVTPCDRSVELERLNRSAISAIVLASELFSAIQSEINNSEVSS